MIGVALGLTFRRTKTMKKPVRAAAIEAAAIALSVTVGILGVKSLTECLLYAQPFAVRVGKNFYAWAADLFMLLASLPVCRSLDRTVRRLYPAPAGE